MRIALRHTRPAPCPSGPGSARHERGESLIEVLGTVVLMGLGFVALLNGIFTVVKISDINQQRTQGSIAVQAWAEALLQPAKEIPPVTISNQVPQIDFTTYEPCAIPGTYGAPSFSNGTLPRDWTATMTIRYLVGYSGTTPVWSSNVGDCYTIMFAPGHDGYTTAPNGVLMNYPRDMGMQELTLKVDSGARSHGGATGERVADTLTIIKRDQRCPGTFDNADLGPC